MNQPSPLFINWYIEKYDKLIGIERKKFLRLLRKSPRKLSVMILDNLHNDYFLATKKLKKPLFVAYTVGFTDSIVENLAKKFLKERKIKKLVNNVFHFLKNSSFRKKIA